MANKQKRYHIYVNYFIQNDSWESISHPNLFVLPKEYTNLNDVKAQMVYDNFPLMNKQNFYLRFFLDDKTQGVKGWVDFPPNAVIPIYNDGHVYVKVLRLPKDVKIKFKNQEALKTKDASTSKINKGNNPNLIFMEDNKNMQKNPSPPPQNNSAFGQNMFSDLNKEINNLGNINQNPNPNLNSNGAQIPPMKPQNPVNIENNMNNMNNIDNMNNMNNMNTMNNMNSMNNIDNMNNMNNVNQNNPNSINIEDWGAFSGNNGSVGGINIDSGGSNSGSSNNINNVDPNLFNVFSNISSPPSQPMQQAPGYDFTQNMKSTGKMNSLDFIPDNLPEEDMKERVNAIINEWAKGGEGQKNLLFLLTTLHEVWKSNSLQIPDMQTLVNNKAKVRTFYKNAMRDLHADKNRDKDPKTKYIASCLYQLLNEANSNY